MLCQKCGERQATFHYKQNINGKKTEIYLCEQCRKEMAGEDFFDNGLNWNDFFGVFESPLSLFGSAGSGTAVQNAAAAPVKHQPVICEHCGMRFEDFKNTGTLGCGYCYDTFKNRMDGVLKRLHGSTKHKGRLPRSHMTGPADPGENTETYSDESNAGNEQDIKKQSIRKQAGQELNSNEKNNNEQINREQDGRERVYAEKDIPELKAMIKNAVNNEDYEEAARLRDIIRVIEAGEDNE